MKLPELKYPTLLLYASIASATLCGLVWAGSMLGLTWDESTYFAYSELLKSVLSNGTYSEAIREIPVLGAYLNPHPPLQKWGAIAFGSTSERIFGYLSGYRILWQIWVAGHLILATHLLKRRSSWWVACAFLLAFLGSPRLLGYASLGVQDGLLMICGLNMALLGMNTTSQSPLRHWLLVLFVTCCCLGAKVTGLLVFLPFSLNLIARRQWKALAITQGIALVGVLFAVAIDPRYWGTQFLAAPFEYAFYPFTRHSVPITFRYLGQNWNFNGPWHWGLAITSATSPILPLGMLLLGVSSSIFVPRLRGFLPYHALWLALMSIPAVPRHDDIRQLLPGIILFLASGTLALPPLLSGSRRPRLAIGLILAALAVSGIEAWNSAQRAPLSYYNQIVGGLKGAERHGFDITLYYESLTPDVLATLNSQLPKGCFLCQRPDWEINLLLLQDHGLLRKDFVIGKCSENKTGHTGVALHYHRKALLNESYYKAGMTLFEYSLGEVSLLRAAPIPPASDSLRAPPAP